MLPRLISILCSSSSTCLRVVSSRSYLAFWRRSCSETTLQRFSDSSKRFPNSVWSLFSLCKSKTCTFHFRNPSGVWSVGLLLDFERFRPSLPFASVFNFQHPTHRHYKSDCFGSILEWCSPVSDCSGSEDGFRKKFQPIVSSFHLFKLRDSWKWGSALWAHVMFVCMWSGVWVCCAKGGYACTHKR